MSSIEPRAAPDVQFRWGSAAMPGSWFNHARYDNAGNVDLVNGTAYQYSYDAESRMITSAVPGSSITASYEYDGTGKRVRKTVNGQHWLYVYDASGALAAECPASGQAAPWTGRRYVMGDMLGSARVSMTDAGAVVECMDYTPFGTEIQRSLRGNMGCYPSNPNNKVPSTNGVNEKFTGKERDAETGLDYFGARYFSGPQGRFTSPDPLLSSANVLNPQTWNKYTYALNNPLKFTDPLGLYVWDSSLGGNVTDEELRKTLSKKEANRIIHRRDEIRNALSAGGGVNNPMVRASIAAYGKEGEANGVPVATGKLAKNVAGETKGQLDYADGRLVATAKVTFDEGVHGDSLTITAAHEGSHVADRQNYAEAANLFGGGSVLDSYNPTRYLTEVFAYQVSAAVAGSLRMPNYVLGVGNTKYEIWRAGWAAVDRAVLDSCEHHRRIGTS